MARSQAQAAFQEVELSSAALRDEDSGHTPLNTAPDSSLADNYDDVPVRPDGDVAEHQAFHDQSTSQAAYVSLDPTRKLPVCLGNGRWVALSAVCTLAIFIGGATAITLWETSLQASYDQFATTCDNLDLQPPLDSIVPVAYNVSLTFTEANFDPNDTTADLTFGGKSTVSFSSVQGGSSVLLHSVGINYTSVVLSQPGLFDSCLCGPTCGVKQCSDVVQPVSVEDCDLEFVRIDLGVASLDRGQNASLAFEYRAAFNPNAGAYRSDVFYNTSARDTQSVLIVTQLEDLGARHVFPSVDEPGQKAVFTLELTFPQEYTGISNTPVAANFSGKGLLTQRHEPSPIMSTYLNAFYIGYVVSKSTTSAIGGYQVNVWSVPLLSSQLDVPLKWAEHALSFYTNWTGIQQPLRKFDLAAVPGKGGAMENWGCLQFDENRFLWNNESEGAYGEWLSADVICHEVAHQWFGNYITTKNWSHLVVNEGSASFMEYLCIESFNYPGIVLSQRAISPTGEAIGIHEGVKETGILADSEPFSAPLVSSIEEPEITPTSEIMYSKGASILFMLYELLEIAKPGIFQEGMRGLLQKHAFGTAIADDVLEAIASAYPEQLNANGLYVKNMTTWYYSPGVPLIDAQLPDAGSQGSLQQTRWLEYTYGDSNASQIWTVPLTYSSLGSQPSSTVISQWLASAQTASQIPANSGATWLADGSGKGLYRTMYSDGHFQSLAAALQTFNFGGNLAGVLRAETLLSESFAFFFKGSLAPDVVLSLVQSAANSSAIQSPEGQYLLGGAILDWLSRLSGLLVDDATCEQSVNGYAAKLLSPLAAAGVDTIQNSERYSNYSQLPFLRRLSQANIIRDAALYGDSKSAQYLCTQYLIQNKSSSGYKLLPDVRGAAYIAAVAQPQGCSIAPSAAEVWNSLGQCWQREIDKTESRRCLFALAYTTDPTLIQLTVSLVLGKASQVATVFPPATAKQSPTAVASADVFPLLKILSRTQVGAQTVWNKMYESLAQTPDSTTYWTNLSKLYLYPSESTLAQLDMLIDRTNTTSTALYREQAYSRLSHNLDWLDMHKDNVCQLLAGRQNGMNAASAG